MIPSIRTFLVINLLLCITLITSLAIIGNFYLEHKDLQRHLDVQLSLAGLTIEALTSDNLDHRDLQTVQKKINQIPQKIKRYYFTVHRDISQSIFQKIEFQVFNRQGKLILKSEDAPKTPLTKATLGFSDLWINNVSWRAFILQNPGTGIRVVVAERYDFRDQLEGRITQDSIFVMLITYPFLGLLIWIIIGRGLDSIREVAQEVEHRAPNYLEPVDLDSVPNEIKPLIDELNNLFSRLKEGFLREKRFASDAAHELRTPLAALRAHTEVALRSGNLEDQKRALEKVIQGVDRATHVVQQLLTLSRTVPEATIDTTKINLHKQAAEIIAMLVPDAIKKNTEIELVAPDKPAIINGAPTAIDILIRNLIDNAIKYTPAGSNVQVIIEETKKYVKLKVTDNGPGIPEKLRKRVFERFFRVLGTEAAGSGLGLGIVQQITAVHNATLSLDEPPSGNGLQVTVSFPKN